MPKLHHYFSACRMHGFGHCLPARDMRFTVQARHIGIALCLMRNRRRLGDDESRTGSLFVISFHQVIGHCTWRTVACEGRHHDAVSKRHSAHLDRREKIRHTVTS